MDQSGTTDESLSQQPITPETIGFQVMPYEDAEASAQRRGAWQGAVTSLTEVDPTEKKSLVDIIAERRRTWPRYQMDNTENYPDLDTASFIEGIIRASDNTEELATVLQIAKQVPLQQNLFKGSRDIRMSFKYSGDVASHSQMIEAALFLGRAMYAQDHDGKDYDEPPSPEQIEKERRLVLDYLDKFKDQ